MSIALLTMCNSQSLSYVKPLGAFCSYLDLCGVFIRIYKAFIKSCETSNHTYFGSSITLGFHSPYMTYEHTCIVSDNVHTY